MKVRTIALALLGIALPSTAPAQTRSAADYIGAIEGVQSSPGPNDLGTLTIGELMARFNVPGVSIAVIHDFEVHWAKGYGIADVETGAAVDDATMFQAASISKPVAAMAVLRAVQDGLFTLDDDINDILESWTLNGGEFTRNDPVTPRMLTSHTSGLGDGFGFPGYDPSGPIPTVVQILDGDELSNVGVLFMERAPMSLMEYSGGGVTLMQQALSDARGRPFADIMRDDVLRPIGMDNSTFEQPLPLPHDCAGDAVTRRRRRLRSRIQHREARPGLVFLPWRLQLGVPCDAAGSQGEGLRPRDHDQCRSGWRRGWRAQSPHPARVRVGLLRGAGTARVSACASADRDHRR
jgi:CubicO group peptidase (beta-lactamase class C family)